MKRDITTDILRALSNEFDSHTRTHGPKLGFMISYGTLVGAAKAAALLGDTVTALTLRQIIDRCAVQHNLGPVYGYLKTQEKVAMRGVIA